mgnify:CR=1 FL=1
MSKIDKQGTMKSDKKADGKEKKLSAVEKKALAEAEALRNNKMARREQLFKQACINQTKQLLSIKLSELDEKLSIKSSAINIDSIDLTGDDIVVHDEPDN